MMLLEEERRQIAHRKRRGGQRVSVRAAAHSIVLLLRIIHGMVLVRRLREGALHRRAKAARRGLSVGEGPCGGGGVEEAAAGAMRPASRRWRRRGKGGELRQTSRKNSVATNARLLLLLEVATRSVVVTVRGCCCRRAEAKPESAVANGETPRPCPNTAASALSLCRLEGKRRVTRVRNRWRSATRRPFAAAPRRRA